MQIRIGLGIGLGTQWGGARTYADEIKSLFGSDLTGFWPKDDASLPVIIDKSANAINGAYAGTPALASVATPQGGMAPQYNGSSNYADLTSAGLISKWDGDELALIFQLAVADPEWVDGGTQIHIMAFTDWSNYILCQHSGANQLSFYITSGGMTKATTINNVATQNFATYAISLSKIHDRINFYLNGERCVAEQTGIGSWAGNLAALACAGYNNTAAYYSKCSESSVILVGREAAPDEIRQVSYIQGAREVISVLGDSISTVDNSSPWSVQTIFQYGGGNKATLKSHAAPSHTIMANMDTQVAAAANDNANKIIIALGQNDNNAGDMGALQTKYESGIAAIKISNPKAIIYGMNVLPIWEDETGAVEVDKSNIRTAIAAACTAQAVACWDTYTVPWRTPEMTPDGLHNLATGDMSMTSNIIPELS